MDQAFTNKHLEAYSTTKPMWNSTLPWNWVKEGTKLVISVANKNGYYITYDFPLEDTVLWSEHTLIRQKFVLFGSASQFKKLNTYTFDSYRHSKGIFGIMPVATLNWVDATVLHWPYLVLTTSKGPRT
jgi:Peptidase M66